MTQRRRAAVPALIGGLVLTALLWWAGASAHALQLPGATSVFGTRTAEIGRWLTPWSYDHPGSAQYAAGGVSGTGTDYRELYETALQIRYCTVFALFVAGAFFLLRWLPPVRGRTIAALLAVWTWGLVAGTLAVTVSAPWLIASQGRGSYRFLPQLASAISGGRQILVVTALAAAAVTVLVARVAVKGEEPPPRRTVPARAARLAATAGTLMTAVSLVVLSHQSVAAALQTAPLGTGRFDEPGELLRQWLLLGAWTTPTADGFGDWLLYRAADVLLLVVVWWALRLLPGLLVRATVPALAVCGVCATVLGLLASQALRMVIEEARLGSDLLYLTAGLGGGVTAALVWGPAAGAVTAVTLRLTAGRAEPAAATTADADEAPARP
ncbi:hypothetical protein [Streptomyces sp. NPDC059786]|uniref:hypothetical protein n=1 Tax=Streptomyces sp. NPDC059786 TaxID=3346946 RepID=UPI0036634EFE